MVGFLVFILFFALILVLFVLSSVIGVIRSVLSLLGFGRKARRAQQQSYGGGSSFEDTTQTRKNKVFDKGEGEYVDYEEVK